MRGLPKVDSKYTKHLHILVRTDQHDFVKNELNGGIATHVRQMIDANMGLFDKELTVLEKEYAVVEPRYLFLKKRIGELKEEKKRQEDELITKEKRIEEAHEKLIEALRRALWQPERIQRATFKVYAEFTGESVETLVAWVKEQAKRRDELEFLTPAEIKTRIQEETKKR